MASPTMASPDLPTNLPTGFPTGLTALPTGLTALPTSLPTGLPADHDLGAAFRSCDEVSLLCPVEATVLGYAPNLGASIFFTISFALMGAATVWIGVRARTWTFMAALGLGCILEMMGPSTPSSAVYRPLAPRARGLTRQQATSAA